jgi:hypothetical protein
MVRAKQSQEFIIEVIDSKSPNTNTKESRASRDIRDVPQNRLQNETIE